MLKTWLNRALAAALEQEEPTLTRKLWERFAEPPQKLMYMLREIREGEQALQEDETHLQELQTLLKLDSVNQTNETRIAHLPQSPATPEPPQPPKGGNRRRVGQRNAKRDVVGRKEQHAS
jgi:hypothetical protein